MMRRSPLLSAALLALMVSWCGFVMAQDAALDADAPIEEAATPTNPPAQLQRAPLPPEWGSPPAEPPASPAPAAEPSSTSSAAPAASEATPTDKAAGPQLITNTFFDTELRQALQDIATQAGVTIIAGQGVSGVVSVDLKDTPLDKALDLVLAGTGYIVKKTPDYYLITSAETDSPDFMANSELSLVHIAYSTATNVIKMLPEAYQPYIKADDLSGSVTVTAPPELRERIIRDIKTLDVRPRQILLAVRVVSLENNNLFSCGIKWQWPTVSAGAFSSSLFHGGSTATGGSWPWGISIGFIPDTDFTNSLLLTLDLMTTNDQASIVSSPQVMAQDGREAKIQVFNEEYFLILAQDVYTRSTLEQIKSGTMLGITPRIAENDEITLQLSTEVSDVIARGEDDLPVVTRRVTTSTVRVQDGGTAAVAGLNSSKSRLAQQNVPWLSRIKRIGNLFRDRTDDTAVRQIAVFVTPYLIREGDDLPGSPPPKPPQAAPVGPEFKTELLDSLRRLQGGSQGEPVAIAIPPER